MNRDKTKQAVRVMQAWADGKPLEFRLRRDERQEWETPGKNYEPSWSWRELEYRIKPEPRVGYVHPLDFHDHSPGCDKGCIRVREVIE